MSILLWIEFTELDNLVKAAKQTDLDFTPEIRYTLSSISSEQVCVQLNPDLFVYLSDRDILIKENI